MRFKENIKQLVISTLFIKHWFKKIFLTKRSKTIFLMTGDFHWFPNTKFSLGDDILFLSACQEITKKYPDHTIFFLTSNVEALKFDGELNYYNYKLTFKYYDSKQYSVIQLFDLLFKVISNVSHLVHLGADVMDGAYGGNYHNSLQKIQIVNYSALLGVKSSIVGFSFNGKTYPILKRALKNASKRVKLYVRDPISYQRLELFIKKNIYLTADVSFNVSPFDYPAHESIDLKISDLYELKKTGKLIVGVNLVSWYMNDIDDFIDRFSKQLTEVENVSNIYFILIPHDYREIEGSDYDILKKLYLKLKSDGLIQVDFIERLYSGIDSKKLISVADVLITGRMHLAIAALSNNIPVLSFIYQGKFEGLYQMYDLNAEYLMDINNVSGLVDNINHIIENRLALSLNIKSKNDEVKALAKLNFSDL